MKQEQQTIAQVLQTLGMDEHVIATMTNQSSHREPSSTKK